MVLIGLLFHKNLQTIDFPTLNIMTIIKRGFILGVFLLIGNGDEGCRGGLIKISCPVKRYQVIDIDRAIIELQPRLVTRI